MNRILFILLILVALSVSISACATVGRLVKPQKGLYEALTRPQSDWDSEIARAKKWHEEVIQHFTPTENLALRNRAQIIADRIVKLNRIPIVIPEVTVLKGEEVNAFTIGGGYIYLFEGLANVAGDESEVAMVIAHELAHCTADHVGMFTWNLIEPRLKSEPTISFPEIEISEEEYEYKGKSYLRISMDAPEPEAVVTLLLAYITSAHARREEKEADIVGAYYMKKAGYDLEKGVEFFREVSRKEAELKRKAIKELDPLYFHLRQCFHDYETIRKKIIENPSRKSLYIEQEAYLKRWLEAKDRYLISIYKWKDVLFQIPVWFRSHPPIAKRVAYVQETQQALVRQNIEGISTKEVIYALSDLWLIEKGLPFPKPK